MALAVFLVAFVSPGSSVSLDSFVPLGSALLLSHVSRVVKFFIEGSGEKAFGLFLFVYLLKLIIPASSRMSNFLSGYHSPSWSVYNPYL
ncbi:MAG: hypothetical protein K0R78_230 [Pelosinus sp.]|nr:hypothetical protein [Pelosinus sp.]